MLPANNLVPYTQGEKNDFTIYFVSLLLDYIIAYRLSYCLAIYLRTNLGLARTLRIKHILIIIKDYKIQENVRCAD
ncbi:hypothetical protein DYBT9623_03534 [Dyadobacter sp. CECT 9623]|uniref:Uncharacterized protein n=1 Tax=Dyadobacter linearis TaxID=2823330 RepID=A0ABM8UTE4_9BACT|nr:hypothetical protein DYBT9623_03534 [Dyadobacter sp. CECT 9623]